MLTDQTIVNSAQADTPRSNILGNVPDRLAVGWEQGRQRDHGWEVPIRVASSDPSVGLGNTIAFISLGGAGGISGKKSDVEATAGEIVRTYNGARDLEHRAAGAERDLDSAAACLAELLDVIAEHEGACPVEPARRLREILAAKPAVFRGTLRCFCVDVFDEDGEALLDVDGSERLAVISLPLSTVDVWAGENVEHGGTYYRDATVFVSETITPHLTELLVDDIERIAGMCGLPRFPADEPALAWLERAVRWNAEQRLRHDTKTVGRRPRIFTFANGCEIDVDRYLGLDATATSRTDHGDRPAITFQLGHGGFLRVAFESEQQRVDELARLRAFRDGAA